jgi:general secretion pathway protein I
MKAPINTHRRSAARGFTLLEVLIALAIVAVSVGALLGTITSSASNVIYLKDKTLAEWVALNRLTEIRINQQKPGKGRRTGNTEMAGMRWQWEEEVTELPVKGMFRIDIRARPTGETVDDSRERPQTNGNARQDFDEGKSAGNELDKLDWMTSVSGVIGSSTSTINTPIAAPLSGNSPTSQQGGPGNPPNAPGTPGAPGAPATPPSPGDPGTSPTPRPGPGADR